MTERKPQYVFLPRKIKDVIDHVQPRQMYELLEAGCDTEFCYILGVIADMKNTVGRISEDHDAILRIPQQLFRRALRE